MADGLLQSLNKAVDDNISYRTGVQRNSLSDALSNLLVTFNKKINDIDTDSLMEVAQKLNNMTGDLSADSILEAYQKVQKNQYMKKQRVIMVQIKVCIFLLPKYRDSSKRKEGDNIYG